MGRQAALIVAFLAVLDPPAFGQESALDQTGRAIPGVVVKVGALVEGVQESYSCTQVLGFSQSMEWYAGLSLADYAEEGEFPDPPPLEAGAFLPTWQGRFFMGGAVERWTDPRFPGWAGPHAIARESPAHCAREEVDRVVFNVSGAARSVDAWAEAIDSVAKLIRTKFPAVRQVVMQPVVGAPEGECPEVRAAQNHPVIAEGIRLAAERGSVAAGPNPKVANCAQFSDALGHLATAGADLVHRALREHYRESTAQPAREGEPIQPEIRWNDNDQPAGTRVGGTLQLDLEVVRGTWRPLGDEGPPVTVLAFAEVGEQPRIPGPMIRVPEGTQVVASINNSLSAPLQLRGLSSRRDITDAAGAWLDAGLKLPIAEVPPGGTREFRFTADARGTYMYQGHAEGAPAPWSGSRTTRWRAP